MSDKSSNHQHQISDSFLSQTTIILVKLLGTWTSVFLHTLFFVAWLYLGFGLERLLVIVSLEAIYIGIFILMAENVETQQREHFRELQRQKDMTIVKKDAQVDEKSLKELKEIKKHLQHLQNIIQKK